MAFDAHVNFGYGTVATAPSPALSGTSLVLGAGQGANFPAVPFNATIWPANTIPLKTNAEIVRVTGISADTLTIVRAQESSTARTILVTDQIDNSVTVKTFTDIEEKFPVSITDGGTGQSTASTARGPSGIAAENYTPVVNADHICSATEHIIAYITTTLTALRTVTLPLANTVPAGHEITIVDAGGVINGFFIINIVISGSDTVDGGASTTLSTATALRKLASDGTSIWRTVDLGSVSVAAPIALGGTSATNKAGAFDALSPVTSQGDIIYRNASTNTRLGAGTSGQALMTGGPSANPAWGAVVDVQTFTTSGTWTKPANATIVRVIAIGSGGGGGSGRLGATGSTRWGGGGGAAGNWIIDQYQAADLTSTVTITIPSGGAGGAAKSGVAANGANGGSPAMTTFGSGSMYVSAAGGGGGGGGTTTTGNAGTATSDSTFAIPWYATGSPPGGGVGGAGAGTAPSGGNNGTAGSPGAGGGGAGITNTNVNDVGAAGGGGGGYDHANANKVSGGAGGASTGTAGTAGPASGTSLSSSLTGGAGGGGGASGTGAANTTGGGAGGAGGLWGGGGGGGGAGTTVTSTGTSGAGGAGGKGYVIVMSFR